MKPHSPWLVNLFMPVMRPIVGFVFFLLGGFRTLGKPRIPRTGGLIILANHISDLDPIAVQFACPRQIYFMGKTELFEMPSISWLIRVFRTFPVRRGEPDKEAIKLAVDLAKGGGVVCIFPEGQISKDAQLQPLMGGAALIVRMAGVPVICCRLSGTQRVMPYGKVIPRPAFRKIQAVWSEAREFGRGQADELLPWAEGELRG